MGFHSVILAEEPQATERPDNYLTEEAHHITSEEELGHNEEELYSEVTEEAPAEFIQAWLPVDRAEDCESGITGTDVSILDSHSAPLICFDTQLKTKDGEECSIDSDEFMEECWTPVDSAEDCESGELAHDIDTDNLPLVCLVQTH